MMEFISKTHKAIISGDGLLRVDQLAPHELRVTQSTPDGIKVDILDKNTATGPELRMLRAMEGMPTFAAGYAGDGEWNADINCGFQRWRGVKPTKDLSKALSNCGFDAKTKKKIMAECKKHKVDYVPRYG